MVTVPSSPSQGRGGRGYAHLHHPGNGQLGFGRGGYHPKQRSNHPHDKEDTQSDDTLAPGYNSEVHEPTSSTTDPPVKANYYAVLDAPDDGHPNQFETVDELLAEEDVEGEIDFEPSTQIDEPMVETRIFSTPTRKTKRKVCSPVKVNPKDVPLKTFAGSHDGPSQTSSKQAGSKSSYRIDTRVVKGVDYLLWKLVKDALQLLAGEEWIYPNLFTNQAIKAKDIKDAKTFEDLFQAKFLRRGHRVHFSMDRTLDIDKAKKGQEIQDFLQLNKIFISRLANSGKEFACHSVFFGVQPSLVPRHAMEAALHLHLSHSFGPDVHQLYAKVQNNFCIYSKNIDPHLDGTVPCRVYGLHVDPEDYDTWTLLRKKTSTNIGLGMWASMQMKSSHSFKESIALQAHLRRNTQVILIQSQEVPDPSKYGETIAVLPHLKKENVWMILATKENIQGVRQLIPSLERISGDYEPNPQEETAEQGLLDWIGKMKPRDSTHPTQVTHNPNRRKLTKRPKLPTVLLVAEAKTQRSWANVARNSTKKPATQGNRHPSNSITTSTDTKAPLTTVMEEDIEEVEVSKDEDGAFTAMKQYIDTRLETFAAKMEQTLDKITATMTPSTGALPHAPPLFMEQITTYLDSKLAILTDVVTALATKISQMDRANNELELKVLPGKTPLEQTIATLVARVDEMHAYLHNKSRSRSKSKKSAHRVESPNPFPAEDWPLDATKGPK
jgi:hypothetical protein